MIPLWQAAILGAVQGIAEFLPISSSAHLSLLPWFFGWQDPGVTFDIALHVGTLVALLVFFFRDWRKLIAAGFGKGSASDRRLFWLIVLASIPAAVLGFLFEKQVETVFRTPLLTAATLAGAGILLAVADRFGRRVSAIENVTARDAVLIGLAQAVSIVPGVSRSGSTITAARALGYGREAAARLSFLLAAPITAGAAAFALRHLRASDIDASWIVGVLVSFVVGLAAIRFLLRYVAHASFRIFAVYRVALAALIVLVWFVRS